MIESHGGWRVMSRVHKELELGNIQNVLELIRKTGKWLCKLGFFSGSPTRKKIWVCRTTFLQPEKNPSLQTHFLPPPKSFLRVQIKRLGITKSLYTANVCRDLQGLCGEIGVRGFQIYEDCMYTRNPCNFWSK